MFGLLSLAIAGVVTYLGFTVARDYTATRLRFVDAIQRPSTPWIVGFAAFGIGVPLALLLPLVTLFTAGLFGASVGFGVASGARKARGMLPPGDY
jgi:hypothetical protein